MKIGKVIEVVEESDWRFFDITVELYNVNDERSKESDCSVCAIKDYKPYELIKIILPFKEAVELFRGR